VVLIHGSGAGVSAAVNWYATIDGLGPGFRVLAPDLVGFGDSQMDPDRPYGIQVWVDHVLAFLDAMGIDRADIVGNSLGGWVGATLAAQSPSRVRRLVLMGTGGTPESATPALLRNSTYRPDLDRMRTVLRNFVERPSLITEDLITYRFEMSCRPGAADTFTATANARNHDRVHAPLTGDVLGGIEAETLVVHGRQDHVIPVVSSWNLLAHLRAGHLVVLDRCGHWAQIEHARRFNLLVSDFLTHGLIDGLAMDDGS